MTQDGKYEKHNLSHSKFYNTFVSIKRRCTNKLYKDYKEWGGRGIKCEWNNFLDFKNDMYESFLDHFNKYGDSNTRIDRIDNNGNYCKENCRWATHIEQARNRRSNHLISFNGKTKTLIEWCEETGLSYACLKNRINIYGWSIEKSLTTLRNCNYKI